MRIFDRLKFFLVTRFSVTSLLVTSLLCLVTPPKSVEKEMMEDAFKKFSEVLGLDSLKDLLVNSDT